MPLSLPRIPSNLPNGFQMVFSPFNSNCVRSSSRIIFSTTVCPSPKSNRLTFSFPDRDLILAGTQQSVELKLALDQEQLKSKKLEESMKLLDEEMKRTDELLYQMIPKQVADRLRKGESPIDTCEVSSRVFLRGGRKFWASRAWMKQHRPPKGLRSEWIDDSGLWSDGEWSAISVGRSPTDNRDRFRFQ